eukprot:Pompholyxophrys_punicea_v1_NODE_304_length_2319_cov_4.614841.p1 type:complete len:146 gc:universal NODE_304_length_2319_cov_4.614841:1618-1181(-)
MNMKTVLTTAKSEDDLRTGYMVEFHFDDVIQEKYADSKFYSHLNYKLKRKQQSPDAIEDIFDGEYYKQIPDLVNFGSIAVGLNTDGVPLFKKSKFSIWPIFLVFYHLPPNIRYKFKNMALTALWFGYEKPDMNKFLAPICNNLTV